MKLPLVPVLFVAAGLAALACWIDREPAQATGGWGIDAVLTRHVQDWQLRGYLRSVSASGVGVLRERGVGSIAGSPESPGKWRGDVREKFRVMRARGFKVVAFANLPFATKPPQPGSQLPEDLREVFAQGRFLGREFQGLVDAWEMVGEPDLGYCTDLPDRVAAYQAALYLGLKAGAAQAARKPETGNLKPEDRQRKPETGNLKPETGRRLGGVSEANLPTEKSIYDSGLRSQLSGLSPERSGLAQAPLVLMGALGLPPGPWLERAAANGLLDYTDAYNFHFYGHAKDLGGVIAAHRAASRRLSAKREGRSAKSEAASAKGQVHGAEGSDALRLPLGTLPTSATELPMWITECGLDAVPGDDFLNPARRQLQAEFTVETARQALAAEDVAVFMPFILAHQDDPYAMTLSADRPLPAWDAYAKFTRENPWPERPLAREPHEPNPIVVQWLSDNRTCLPRKVGGTYRFRANESIKGELRVYSFGEQAVRGRLSAKREGVSAKGDSRRSETGDLRPEEKRGGKGEGRSAESEVKRPETGRRLGGDGEANLRPEGSGRSSPLSVGGSSLSGPDPVRIASNGQPITALGAIDIAPGGMYSVPIEIRAVGAGYFRETVEVTFVPEHESGTEAAPPGLGVSVASFGLEAGTSVADFDEEPLRLKPLPDGIVRFPQAAPFTVSGQSGVWTLTNGLKGEPALAGSADARSGIRMWIEESSDDPLAPPAAVAAVDGIPRADFLRLQLDRPMSRDCKVLVVLVDDRGQRYSIWENFGADYYGSRSDVWLNLQDIHADFWGPMSADYAFRPERIREVHLRVYLKKSNDPVGVALSLLRAKR